MFIVPVTRHSKELALSLDRLFDDTFERLFSAGNGSGPGHHPSDTLGTRTPALDVAETERGYTVTLEMPGVAKPDVQVQIDGRRVSVQAHAQTEGERKDGDRIVYRERSSASYARSFTLPVEIDQAESQARLEHGVLRLTLPKRGARGAAQITVD